MKVIPFFLPLMGRDRLLCRNCNAKTYRTLDEPVFFDTDGIIFRLRVIACQSDTFQGKS